MELKIKTQFDIGDTVFWVDNDPSKWWYDHIFEGIIKSITTDGHTVSYGIDVTSAEDMLTGADKSPWHKGGWRHEKEACKCFANKATLRKLCLGDRLRHKVLSIEKEIEVSTGALKLVQENLKSLPAKSKELKAKIAELKKEKAGIDRQLKKIR